MSQSSLEQKVTEMHRRLKTHFGPQAWWPAESPLEVMVGAVLTQNTNWRNVEKAISRLKDKKLLTVERLNSIPTAALAEEIRPAGYYNVKARRLKNLFSFVAHRYNGSLARMMEEETQRLRTDLLSVTGIGPETADSILLYAADRPVFVVDAYTRRILERHEAISAKASYLDVQHFFTAHLASDAGLYNEFHALIVQTGKSFCRKRPLCGGCPLESWAEGPRPNIEQRKRQTSGRI